MSWSLGEIRALSVKAARGAGMDWGMAEEAGFAVQWLEASGLNGVKALSQYLSRVHRDGTNNEADCPLKLGCIVSDSHNWTLLEGKECCEPMLLIPFISNVLKEETLFLGWGDVSVLINRDGVRTHAVEFLNSTPSASKQSIHIKIDNTPCRVLSRRTRVSEDNASYVAILNALAHKVYAPATEASRLSGAGAGLNDND